MSRYLELCNRRGNDWWSIVFGYPVARAVLVPLANLRWVTPTGITWVGFLVKCAAIAAVWRGGPGELLVAAALLQIAQVFDSMDGTLARYRGTSSPLGAYLDKVLDAVSMFLLLIAVGVRGGQEEPCNLLYAVGAGGAFLVGCYALWIARAIAPPEGARLDGAAPVATTWGAVASEWLRGWPRIVRFQEADLYFWIGLGAVLGLWTWLCIGLVVTQVGKAVGVLVYHGMMIYRRAP